MAHFMRVAAPGGDLYFHLHGAPNTVVARHLVFERVFGAPAPNTTDLYNLIHEVEVTVGDVVFVTDDGYRLAIANGRATDGDLVFALDAIGCPIDHRGYKVPGRFEIKPTPEKS